MMSKTISYLFALLLANMKSYAPDKMRLFVMALFMMIQNSMFFVFWIILFESVSDLKGWRLEDFALMYGMVSSGVGISLFFCNGARTIAYRIQDGSLDSFIAKPRAVLPLLLFSSSSPASLGDILYGPLMWSLFVELTFEKSVALGLLTVNAALLFTALTVIIYSLGFWLKNNPRFHDQLFEMLIILSANVTHGQPVLVRMVLFTLIPTAFMNYLPVELVRGGDPVQCLLVVGASVFYGGVAIMIFNAGIRRYVGGLSD